MQSEVYWNLHRDVFSVRQDRRVVAHAQSVLLKNVKFVVRPAGRLAVIATGHKNVHAFVKGSLDSLDKSLRKPKSAVEVVYNPYKYESFVRREGGGAIWYADAAILRIEDGRPRVYAVE